MAADGATILIVEDEPPIRRLLRTTLAAHDYRTLEAGTGAEALHSMRHHRPDLVLLDLGLPDIDGTEVLRQAAGRAPVIVLTARASVDERIHGLQLGADDYVVKPFSPTEVVLRVQAVLARGSLASSINDTTSFGDGLLVVDESRHLVTLNGDPIDLTATEWGILMALTSVPGRVYSRYELVNRVRGYEFAGYERTIDSHIKNLRRKLGSSGSDIIETVVGVGYRLGIDRDR